ncbi:hypothetical protein ACOMHN_023153 [Nucella lapillus]
MTGISSLKIAPNFAMAGGRSRLHLIDLGSASKSRDPANVSLSLSALGNVIMALLNGQRHVPHRAAIVRVALGKVISLLWLQMPAIF